MSNRFTYNYFSMSIRDEQTGYIYSDLEKICTLMNQLNERADRNVELCDCEKSKNIVYKNFVDDVMKILNKYGIKDLEKLDQILFNQRVW